MAVDMTTRTIDGKLSIVIIFKFQVDSAVLDAIDMYVKATSVAYAMADQYVSVVAAYDALPDDEYARRWAAANMDQLNTKVMAAMSSYSSIDSRLGEAVVQLLMACQDGGEVGEVNGTLKKIQKVCEDSGQVLGQIASFAPIFYSCLGAEGA